MNLIKILFVFGTRPEAIKMLPLIKEFKKETTFNIKICVTAQHREMLDQVLNLFDVVPDYDLNIMKPNQDLFSITSNILLGLKPILAEFEPKYVFVHGDTTTSMAAALAATYANAIICHVEAGLRTNDKSSPFPEEINRQLTSRIADYHFAPTEQAKANLLKENIAEEKIIVTGNTVIDALMLASKMVVTLETDEIKYLKNIIDIKKKIILVTGHRRENHGTAILNICAALKETAIAHQDVQIIYPLHLNPNIFNPVKKILAGTGNIYLIQPLAYSSFVWLMNKSHIILTDSGGIQEEAPSLGKPVLVMRETSERPEAIKAGTAILVGSDVIKIKDELNTLLNDVDKYNKMALRTNPFGDGYACKRIVSFFKTINI